MDFRFDSEDEAFRREIRAFIASEWSGGTGDAAVDTDEEYEAERAFEKKLAQRGWLTLAWPKEYGGQGATNIRQAIMKEECSYARAPIGGGPGGETEKESAAKKPRPKKRHARTTQKPTAPRSKGETPPPAVRPGTKQARKNGAAIDEAVEAMGWQPHSVRGAISGALKKKLGLTVISATVEGRGRVYRIVEPG